MKIFFLLIGCIVGISATSQSRKTFTLFDIVLKAQTNSPTFKLAQTQREIRTYEYQTYLSDLRPQISLYGNAPVYTKQYTSVIQPDGNIQYLPIQQNLTNVGFSLSQAIAATGGRLSLNTEINHFYNFRSKFNQYNGTPVFLRLDQPLFGFNDLKWKKKIEPLVLEQSKREYIYEVERIAQQTTLFFFDVLESQSNIDIAQLNVTNTLFNYEIEKKRVNLGTTTEDKLLQLELQSLNSQQELEKARYTFGVSLLALRTFIGDNDTIFFGLEVPDKIPSFSINLEDAKKYVKKNRPEFIGFERKRLEAEREVVRAKAAQQEVNLTASYGLNRAAATLGTVYNDPRDQQLFSIGLNVPIIDWGRRKARYNTARAVQKLTDYNNKIDESVIEQEVTTLVENIMLLQSNIKLARTTDSIAHRRYDIANRLYQSGKLSITDLNLAQGEKDAARRSFISALRDFWNAYYQVRRLTMFDFEQQKNLY